MTPTLHVQLLGRFGLTVDDAPGLTLDSPRLQALLAYLLLHRTAPHARAHLAFQLWPDTSESQAHANLRTLLHRLRQALPEANRFLHIDAQTVQWRSDAPATLDVAEFERALAQAAAAEQVGDQDAARAALRDAVEQYGGDLLPALYDDWVLLERERLRQAFLTGLEKLVLLLEQANEYPAATGYAQRLLRHDPLHEASYQHLMRLHAASGDRASAVRIYRTCATVLQRELGVEPSPATHEAYEGLRHVEAQPPPASRTTSLAEGGRRHNLPIVLTSFIGRAHELAEVQRLLARTRLLTLTGAGGCGKTRLALAVANEVVANYPDGVWLVELGALADPKLVPQALAAVLGVREELQRPLTTALIDVLQPRKLLLLVDNCEHLIEACAQLATTLLGACPHLHILATSREALGVGGETTWLVPSLSLPPPQQLPPLLELTQSEAVELFIERAAATLPTFTLTQTNAGAVAAVCRRLDGIPLAIELAAARVKVLTVDQLARRLDDCLRLLTGGSRTVPLRQQTLAATIAWSYDLLSEPERALFRRLSVFAGGWTLEAAEAICTDGEIAEDAVLELLAHLVDKSLVLVDLQSSGEARYWLLETVRQYGHERLREARETVAIERHAAYYLALAEHAEPRLRGPEQRLWLDRLEREHDNLRTAVEWGLAHRPEDALRLAASLYVFWNARGNLTEARRWVQEALARVDALPAAEAQAADQRERAITKGLIAVGQLATQQGEHVAARAALSEAVAIARANGDKLMLGIALGQLARTEIFLNDIPAVRVAAEESVALARELGDVRSLADALPILAWVAGRQGNDAVRQALFEEARQLIGAADNPDTYTVLAFMGTEARSRGDLATARLYFQECVKFFRWIKSKQFEARVRSELAHISRQSGDYQAAKDAYRQTMLQWKELSHRAAIARQLECFAFIARAQSQLLRALRLLGAAEALREAIGMPMTDDERAEYDREVAVLHAQMDEDIYVSAWAKGRAMTLEQAIAYALEEADSFQ